MAKRPWLHLAVRGREFLPLKAALILRPLCKFPPEKVHGSVSGDANKIGPDPMPNRQPGGPRPSPG